MRILLLTNLFPTERSPQGGVFISERVRAHRDLGDSVRVVAIRPDVSPVFTGIRALLGRSPSRIASRDYAELRLVLPPLDHVRQGRGPFPKDRLLERSAARLLASEDVARFDAIHAHGMYMAPAGAVARHLSAATGVPFVVTVHGSDINVMMPYQPEAYARVLNSAGAAIYVSSALRERALALGAKGENAIVVPNGVDVRLFSPEGQVSDCQSPSRGVRIAFVGSLSKIKGADLLPEIFQGIAATIRGVSFVIVGDGPLRSAVEPSMAGLDVEFLGTVPRERVADVLRDADLAVLPSRSEGWPCVILEAHACGTPVLGSDAGGSPEAIGDPRFVVRQGEGFVERFIEVAARVLQGSLIPGELRSRALEHSWLKIAERETAILTRVAAQAPRGG